jgi:hypothetical protein
VSKFKILETRGKLQSADRPLAVHIYPNNPRDESAAKGFVKDGVTQLLDQLFGGPIDFYEVYYFYDTRYCPQESSKDAQSLYEGFKSWYQGKYDHRIGVHLVTDTEVLGGRSDGGDGTTLNSFNNARCCAAGSDYSGSEGRSTAAHETLHSIINNELPGVKDMLPDGDEHYLGKVYSDGNTASPFANNNNERSLKGDCSADREQDTESTTITSCAYDAVQLTSDDAFE